MNINKYLAVRGLLQPGKKFDVAYLHIGLIAGFLTEKNGIARRVVIEVKIEVPVDTCSKALFWEPIGDEQHLVSLLSTILVLRFKKATVSKSNGAKIFKQARSEVPSLGNSEFGGRFEPFGRQVPFLWSP